MTAFITILVVGTLTLAFIGAAFYIVQAFCEDKVLRAYLETDVDHAEIPSDRCSQRTCTGEATWTVHDGIVARRVCFFCAVAGFRKGTWVSFHTDKAVFDQACEDTDVAMWELELHEGGAS